MKLFRDLIDKAFAFRRTPIVADDFPAMRDVFDSALTLAEERLKNHPKVICLCGSTRFATERKPRGVVKVEFLRQKARSRVCQ